MGNGFDPINFVVPTGNFGNAYAGFISKKMGLPVGKIVIGSNKNDILTRFFLSGKMIVKKTKRSLSPSMDIQVSSNFERLLFDYFQKGKIVSDFYKKLEISGEFNVGENNLKRIKCFFKAGKLSDKKTEETIKLIKDKYNIILDPHTAVGVAVGKNQLPEDEKRICLATAHYGKFQTQLIHLLTKGKISKRLLELKKKEKFYEMNNKIEVFKVL